MVMTSGTARWERDHEECESARLRREWVALDFPCTGTHNGGKESSGRKSLKLENMANSPSGAAPAIRSLHESNLLIDDRNRTVGPMRNY